MKQVIQNLKDGTTALHDVPVPLVRPGHLLIRSCYSVVSKGTEKMLVDFGKANLLNKARQQPDKVRQVLQKLKSDGLVPTLQSVQAKLNQPLSLGYCNVGEVVEVGTGVDGYAMGDFVVSNGPHAEYVCVPKHLCAKVPDGVALEDAAFTVLGSIGLQGLRLAQPTLGETFVVTGLGLIGLITVQLLAAHGCHVIAIDYDAERLAMAASLGARTVSLSAGEDPLQVANAVTLGRGVDGVILTASTASNEPIHQAAQMCRKRGRIILVGVSGLALSRADFYEKELTFQVSCSYGPGRYDANYEERGQDYPFGYVRWTAQRNFTAILEMMRAGKLIVQSLISHRYPIAEGQQAYELLRHNAPSLGIMLVYDTLNEFSEKKTETLLPLQASLPTMSPRSKGSLPVVGLIGAGHFTNQVLLPAIQSSGASLRMIASQGGVHGVHVGKKFGFAMTTTDASLVMQDANINTVFITTRHHSHAHFVKEAILAGKHVFVEKPLCITREQMIELSQLPTSAQQLLMIGFNRRFAPQVVRMKQLLATQQAPLLMVMTVNAGQLPADHWTKDAAVGGGRIIGEACHFIDLLRHLAGSPIQAVTASSLATGNSQFDEDHVTMTINFQNGSMGTIHYFANGHKAFPKERLEVFVDGKALVLDNFRKLRGLGWKSFRKMNLWSQDKGHQACVRAFIDSIATGSIESPIPRDEIFEVTAASFDIMEQIREQQQKKEAR
jgi:predicted dehydrogenase/threonine dehydrogenase-like Zn-dependent dehydrogenase